MQFTADNDKVKLNKSYNATIITPACIAGLAIIMMIALVHDIKIGIVVLSFLEVLTLIILGATVFICIGIRLIAETIGQIAYIHLINEDEEWLEKRFKVIWSTIEDGYTILTTEEAEKLEIDKMQRKF